MKQALTTNLTYDFTVSPTLLISARVGGAFSPSDGGPQWSSGFNPDEFPYDPSVKAWASQDRLPFSTIIGSNGGWGGTRIVNADHPHSDVTSYTNYNTSISLTKLWNKHTIKVGGEHRRYYDNFLESGLGWMAFNGFATLHNAFGGEWVETNPDMVAANGWGDFLLGYLNQTQQSAPWTMALGFKYWAGFVQDDWKVTPNLTLNLGLRWDTETPVTERRRKLLVAWIPTPFGVHHSVRLELEQRAQRRRTSLPRRSPFSPSRSGRRTASTRTKRDGRGRNARNIPAVPCSGIPGIIAPRFGAAYRLNNKTTLRASGGMMYISATGGYYGMWTRSCRPPRQ